eukprot:CAMPEP_0181401332 /NCGR_PEP_ID=MMETSP1110-20121109/2593_1 /TAXON_ID=174948 /ORGANISM="Symbiodinium sp., Strain CCMP421" /LENGTH=297 /DNA_ID=CAMNT_0023523493 /DNA_START=169 /DNA_END=1062 /DNA_ORIENTATION=+
MSLPLVGVTGIDACGTPAGLALTRQELSACSGPCSGALALRRVTTLLQGARRADAQGETQQAQELYSEVLKVQKSFSRAPMGGFGKSLRDVATGVEARLTQLKQEIQEEACSSRPATSSRNLQSRGAVDDHSPQDPKANGWPVMECLSARDGYDGRPATRDGVRPCTQEGAGRWRGGSLDGSRPVTRDGEHSRQRLDGVRPSTRDGARLQQMIDGNRRSDTRPGTRDGRPPTRGATGERKQDISLRQVTRKKRQPSQHAPEVLSFESPSPEDRAPCEWAPECLSPCMDADESVELLE